ncbi:MAG: hypothetical protein V1918_09360 [Planctomycetota bacterium]
MSITETILLAGLALAAGALFIVSLFMRRRGRASRRDAALKRLETVRRRAQQQHGPLIREIMDEAASAPPEREMLEKELKSDPRKAAGSLKKMMDK